MKEKPTWDNVKLPHFPFLTKSNGKEFDVAIIGGGITGITCAYLLSLAGKKTILLEKGNLCFGATGVTTAFLTQNIDTELKKLIRMFGKEDTKAIRESHQYAIDQIEKIIAKNKINCEFTRCSNYSYALDEKDAKNLKDEAIESNNLGIEAKFRKDNKLGFDNFGYLELPEQAKFHPLKYLSSLVKIASKNGAKIFEKTEVKSIEKDDFLYSIKTSRGNRLARHVIIATHAPFDKKLYFKKAFYTSYVIEAVTKPGIIKEGIYEDTLNPYHYFRIDREGRNDRIIIGGEDHRSDIPITGSKNFQALLDYMKALFPDIKFKITGKWKGPIIESVDGLAYIGRVNDENIFYATGFSGNGMTYGTLAAYIISSQILNKRDAKLKQFSDIYAASRTPGLVSLANKGVDYSSELIHGAIRNSLKYGKGSLQKYKAQKPI